MITQKNRVMLYISCFTMILSAVVYIVHQYLGIHFGMGSAAGHSMSSASPAPDVSFLRSCLACLPFLTWAAALLLYRFRPSHSSLPLLNTLTLTFSSIGTIASGNGLVEYHFSIFMVLAMLLYYESIPLLLLSTILFAAQHLLGFIWFPELVYGTEHYSFDMELIQLGGIVRQYLGLL